MKTSVGMWIDHRKAVIVFVNGDGEETRLINCLDDKPQRQSGVSTPADDVRQRELTGQLNIFYDDVIANIRDAGSVLIFGPGEAKGELKKRMKKDSLDGNIVGVEAADRMTDPQIAAKVRAYFHKQL